MQVETNIRTLRFLDTVVRVHAHHEDAPDGVSVIESWAAYGDSPPLHVHHTEDELFFVLSGELRVRSGDDDLLVRSGGCARTPRGVPHTYRVVSTEGARWLVVTSGGDFERFVLELSQPAEQGAEPLSPGAPTPEQVDQLGSVALAHGIELVGPPLD
jgi:mannose-6-phosphate isomerase-like protein (cupin superfamily)